MRGPSVLRALTTLARSLLTILTAAVLFAFNFELVGIVAFRYLYNPHSAMGHDIALVLHALLSGVLTAWMYRQFFHDHLWRA